MIPPAPAADVPAFMASLTHFLNRSGFSPRDFTVGGISGTSLAPGRIGRGGVALPGRVDFGPGVLGSVQAAAIRMGRRGPLNQRQIRGIRTGLHEGLHQVRYGRTPEVATANVAWEEGVTDAVTRDLLPIAARKLYGRQMMGTRRRERRIGPQQFDAEVRNIRQLSVFGSGAGRWEDYKARAWRGRFQRAEQGERQKMHDAALAAQAVRGAR